MKVRFHIPGMEEPVDRRVDIIPLNGDFVLLEEAGKPLCVIGREWSYNPPVFFDDELQRFTVTQERLDIYLDDRQAYGKRSGVL